ncbi:uncharacterized protein LOC124156845 [Ischnura elegans]|uniref:uncharacterized protein LOC124156845 n=1 Tax=Ischnura elegans TaxID=197161 RepID=UPI001ED89E0D|nr:uncharacterized protein LOC124156845 [Ischnura elegans]
MKGATGDGDRGEASGVEGDRENGQATEQFPDCEGPQTDEDNGRPLDDESPPSIETIRAWVLEKPFYSRRRWKPPTIPFLFYDSERVSVERMKDESTVGITLCTPPCDSAPRFDRGEDVLAGGGDGAADDRLQRGRFRSKRDGFLEECLAEAADVLRDPAGVDLEADPWDVVALIFSIALYSLDTACDAAASALHFANGRVFFGAKTALLIAMPYFGALLRSLIWELRNYKNKDFKSTFELKEIFLISNYFKSFECAYKSQKDFTPIASFYKEVDQKRDHSSAPRDDALPIGKRMKYLSRRMGEKYQINEVRLTGLDNLLQTGPQALLQLVYLMDVTILHGRPDLGDIFLKFKLGLSIFVFSWTVQRQHYARHFNPRRNNNCRFVASIYETILLVMVHGSRIGCFTAWILWKPLSFVIFWPCYLLLLSITSFTLRKFRERGEADESTTARLRRPYAPAWPVYRFYTIDPDVMLWSLSSYDHVLYLLETTTPWVVIATIVGEVHLQLIASALIFLTLVSYALFYRYGQVHSHKCTTERYAPR